MKRREFIKSTTLLAAGSVVAPATGFAGTAPMAWIAGFRTGVASGAVDGQYDPRHNAHVEFLDEWRRLKGLPDQDGEFSFPSRNTDKSDPLPSYGLYVACSGIGVSQAIEILKREEFNIIRPIAKDGRCFFQYEA